MELLFALLQLGFLLLDAHDEHLAHLVLLGLQLRQMVAALRLERLLERDRLVVAIDIGESHLFEPLLAVQLVVARMRLLAHILHVGADQHLAQFHKVTVRLILHLHRTPRVLAGPYNLVSDAHQIRTANHGERDVRVHHGVAFRHRLVVGWELIDMHTVRPQLVIDFGLKLGQLRLRDRVRLRDDRDDVHLRVEHLHADEIERL
uniref:Putative secreted protein n=1 Tax=Anopheles marajoara TaxID=58244 RepID=A0A2M4C5R9_9DIPT